ncbi:uncharacterized protein LOC143462424 isoform X2 [Clavelina lepadiformis]
MRHFYFSMMSDKLPCLNLCALEGEEMQTKTAIWFMHMKLMVHRNCDGGGILYHKDRI